MSQLMQGAIVCLAVMAATSCAQRSGRSLPQISATTEYDRESLQYLIHFSDEARQMTELCVKKAQRPDLKQYCSDLSEQERIRVNKLQNWLEQWYRAKPDSAKQRAEHSSEEVEHFLAAMRSSVGEKFEEAFLSGLRVHIRDGGSHTAECDTRAVHTDYRQFCSAWNIQQEETRKKLSSWICQWFRDCLER